MRTTIRLEKELLTEAKLFAARSGKTLTAVIEDALRETLSRAKNSDERRPVRLTTVTGNGLQPGADLDDSAALLAHMEVTDDSS